MAKIVLNIGNARNASIIYCYYDREIVTVYAVPPCHCRTTPPNVVSLSSKAHLGKQ